MSCGDGFECGHHVGWFWVERGGAACTLVVVYMSIRLSETVSEFRSIQRFRTQDTGHRTTGYEPGNFTDLTNSTPIAASSTRSRRSTDRLDTCTDDMMAESTAITIKKFDGADYKSWSLEIEILFEQKQVLGIVDGTEEAPDSKDRTEFKARKKQHGIARSTILLAIERSLQQQYGVQKDPNALWDQLKENYKSKVKLNVWALRDEMSAVKLSNCENVQEYASKIQGYVNDFNLCAESSTGTMPKSEHSYYLMQGIPKDDHWRFFTQLMYDKIDTLADKPEEIVTKMKAHEARLQKDDDSEVAAMFSKLQTKSNKRRQARKSRNTRGSGSVSDGSSSYNEKHVSRRTNWRDTQECYRCHKKGHIARYCPSTAPVVSGAPTETTAAAAATTMTTTSIENYWMTVTGRSPEKEGWYMDCATTTHICGDQQRFEQYTEYTKREEREICDFAGRKAGKATGHGDVRLRLRLPGGRKHEVVVRNVLHVEGAPNSLSQSWLMDWGLRIVPVNGYGIKIYDKVPAEYNGRSRGNLVGVAPQIGGLFRLDMKFAGKRYRARGWLLRRNFEGILGLVSFGRTFRESSIFVFIGV